MRVSDRRALKRPILFWVLLIILILAVSLLMQYLLSVVLGSEIGFVSLVVTLLVIGVALLVGTYRKGMS